MMLEILMMLLPLALSRDTMDREPAANGKNLRPIQVEKLLLCQGIVIVVELKGRIVR